MDVTILSLSELEQLLDRYPWFTLARKEYVRRHRAFGEEDLREAASRAGIYVLSRSEFLAEISGKRKNVASAPVPPAPAPAVVAAPVEASAVAEPVSVEAPAVAETHAETGAPVAPAAP